MMTPPDAQAEMELFLQGEGIREIVLVRVARAGRIQQIVEVARTHGLSAPDDAEVVVLVEESDEPLALQATLEESGIRDRDRVHVHRCRSAAVTVNFNAEHKLESFPSSATVARVRRWAVGKHGFDLTPIDATEHVLQVCGSTTRPDEDIHIGTLVTAPACDVCFDLVAKQRVEG